MNLTDRYNEIAAVAAASQVAEILTALAMEPSGKRFTKSRAEAHNRWTQLAELATARARAASAPAPMRAKRAKPAPAPATPVVIPAP